MRDSAAEAFLPFTTRYEGRVRWMYVDVKGLVTVGVGNLIDPKPAALGLPFVSRHTGEAVRPDRIGEEWDRLKADAADLGRRGHRACEAITDLRLPDDAIDELVWARVTTNEAVLTRSFADFALYPADAQLGLHSMAWALGAAFAPRWPRFSAAVRALDFATAADECRMREVGNPGVVPRNDANQQLFRNAAAVLADGTDPDVLVGVGVTR
jgi:GH24 family phage-related lysozyme (muramidase)